jgi:copper chaperone CopZ
VKKFLAAVLILVPALAFAQGQNYEVQIKEGEMHCEDCAKEVSKALQALPDVDKGSVKIVLAKNKAYLHVNNAGKVSVNDIKATLKNIGYTVVAVQDAPAAKTN